MPQPAMRGGLTAAGDDDGVDWSREAGLDLLEQNERIGRSRMIRARELQIENRHARTGPQFPLEIIRRRTHDDRETRVAKRQRRRILGVEIVIEHENAPCAAR